MKQTIKIDADSTRWEADPYKRVWGAVMFRAIMDANGVTGGDPLRQPSLIRKAEKWIWSDDYDLGSFCYVCDILNIAPEKVRMTYKTRECVRVLIGNGNLGLGRKKPKGSGRKAKNGKKNRSKPLADSPGIQGKGV